MLGSRKSVHSRRSGDTALMPPLLREIYIVLCVGIPQGHQRILTCCLETPLGDSKNTVRLCSCHG